MKCLSFVSILREKEAIESIVGLPFEALRAFQKNTESIIIDGTLFFFKPIITHILHQLVQTSSGATKDSVARTAHAVHWTRQLEACIRVITTMATINSFGV